MAYEATTNLGLQKAVPGSNQAFETAVFNENWDAIDGVFPLDSASIADGAVVTNKLAAGAVVGSKIADGEVSAGKLAADSVTSGKIAADAVTSSKLAADSVVTAKILDANVTKAKLASDVTSFFAPLDAPAFTTSIAAPYAVLGGRRLWIQATDPGVDAAAGDLWIDLP